MHTVGVNHIRTRKATEQVDSPSRCQKHIVEGPGLSIHVIDHFRRYHCEQRRQRFPGGGISKDRAIDALLPEWVYAIAAAGERLWYGGGGYHHASACHRKPTVGMRTVGVRSRVDRDKQYVAGDCGLRD